MTIRARSFFVPLGYSRLVIFALSIETTTDHQQYIDELYVEVSDKLDDDLHDLTLNIKSIFSLLTLTRLALQHPEIKQTITEVGIDVVNVLTPLIQSQPTATRQAITEFWKAIDKLETVPKPTEKSHCISTLSHERQQEYLTLLTSYLFAIHELTQVKDDFQYWIAKIQCLVTTELEQLSSEEFEEKIAKCDRDFIYLVESETA